LAPLPSVTATAIVSANPGSSAFANVNFSLDYFFYIDGPGANTGATIPLNVIATATASVGGSVGPSGIGSPVGTATEGLIVQLKPGLITGPSLLMSTSSPAGFSLNQDLNVLVGTNYIYDVTMNVQVIAGADGSTTSAENATAALDPMFTIDLPLIDADQYQIFFSDGIGNGATNAATPLPAALPLFAGGLGALSVLGWRSRKKSAARAA